MPLRPLSEEEKKLTQNGIDRLISDNEYLEYLVEYTQLMINKGLKMNYEKQLKEKKQELNNYLDILSGNKKTVESLQTQIDKGVEIKDIKIHKEVKDG